jgi:thioredoxin-like negative regulator of GroEL
MKAMFPLALLSVATLGLAACTKGPEEEETAGQAEPVVQPGSAEQVGKQIDQAVLDLKQRAIDAESRLGEKLIDAGKSLKREQTSDPSAIQ